jgi:dihydrofolate reductase
MEISLIAAASLNNVIGKNGDIPWDMPRDMRLFREITTGHHILSGRKNYMSIPDKYRPLEKRVNMVVTRNVDFHDKGALVFHAIEDAVEYARKAGENELMIIGGGEIYKECLKIADNIYLSRIQAEIDGDTYFPEVDEEQWMLLDAEYFDKDEKNPYDFSFEHYVRR